MTSTQNQKARLEPKERAQHLLNEKAPAQKLQGTITITVWLSATDQKIALNWTNTGPIGRWDYVALFSANPQQVGALGYLTNQWQYTSEQSSPYITGTSSGKGNAYWIAYCAWDYGQKKYVVVESSGPFEP